jgi:hypothetical protein
MTAIRFDKPETWFDLVDAALGMPETYFDRLSAADLERAHWDCSGLDAVFDYAELQIILGSIEQAIAGCSIRLYHGCRLNDGEIPSVVGLRASSTDGITASLLELAERDPVLRQHVEAINEKVSDVFYRDQARCRNNQIWFCLTEHEMIEEGGVYSAFGSEYRLLILNGIDQTLKYRLFRYGTPAIVAVELPIDPYLLRFKGSIAKFLFSLWIHHRLEFHDTDKPGGFACYIETDVPPEHVREILRPKRVHDQYNRDSRSYSWDEIFIRD